ncbi:hypothetical protein C1H46_010446 [Malus baccata]|uniref:Uncharacterized protein n=1 Tax=Malus baccata TaxID=106549 RepID=A0A540MYT6_MALBA|nr:hypothetical protein C1H46_010446 [Malus baccata]
MFNETKGDSHGQTPSLRVLSETPPIPMGLLRPRLLRLCMLHLILSLLSIILSTDNHHHTIARQLSHH